MPAVIAALLAFAIAFVLHLAKSFNGAYWVDAELIGFIFLALALLAPGWWGMRGPRS
jgi:hypothetical protein